MEDLSLSVFPLGKRTRILVGVPRNGFKLSQELRLRWSCAAVVESQAYFNEQELAFSRGKRPGITEY